ncbi:MAG: hypothetical protein ACRDHN_03780 [Thermomicrobiales bacterium]
MSSGGWLTLIVIVLIILFLLWWFRRRQSQATTQQNRHTSSTGGSSSAAGPSGSTPSSTSEPSFESASSSLPGDGSERMAGASSQGYGLSSNAPSAGATEAPAASNVAASAFTSGSQEAQVGHIDTDTWDTGTADSSDSGSTQLTLTGNTFDSSSDLLEDAKSVEPAAAFENENTPAAGNEATATSYGIAAQPALAAAKEAEAAAATGTPEGQKLSEAINQRMYLGAQPEEDGASASLDAGNTAETPAWAAGASSSSAGTDGGLAANVSGTATEAEAGRNGYVTMDGHADECPDAYPIKGNASSRIYHRPEESSYLVTIPEICFADVGTAEAMGFRARRSGGSAGSHDESGTTGGASSTTAAFSAYGIASNHPDAAATSSPPAAKLASSGAGQTRRAPGQGYRSMTGDEHDCPSGFPIKGNESSKIFHRPGESSYDRTIPEICFADEGTAVSMGFRERKH